MNDECIIDNSLNDLKIPKEAVALTLKDAENVALMYLKKQSETKSFSLIRNIITVRGKDGTPAVYAVNFNDGYILVSATKEYYPILAEVPHGTFSENDSSTGEDVLMIGYLNTISNVKSENIDKKLLRTLWSPFESNSGHSEAVSYLANSDEIYKNVLDKWLMQWYDEGRNAYYLFQKPENMPDDVYDSFCQLAESMTINGYDYMQCSMITEFVNDNNYSSISGPFIRTEWKQKEPFNSADPERRPLGCTTIAAGQIMRYFEHPDDYLWDEMPNNTSNSTLSNFLFELRQKINVNDGGGASINDVRRTLRDYGYSCEVQNHNQSDVVSSLSNNRPVYMRGNNAENDGHAWVCDGTRTSMPYVEYELFVLTGNGEYLDFMEVDSRREYAGFLTTYHMNWGQYGAFDGWYVDNYTDYSQDRKDIIIKGY